MADAADSADDLQQQRCTACGQGAYVDGSALGSKLDQIPRQFKKIGPWQTENDTVHNQVGAQLGLGRFKRATDQT